MKDDVNVYFLSDHFRNTKLVKIQLETNLTDEKFLTRITQFNSIM